MRRHSNFTHVLYCTYRHMVASRDISAGELIMQELPCSLGPGHYTPPVCLGCYRTVDGSVTCARCGWPICSEVRIPIHIIQHIALKNRKEWL